MAPAAHDGYLELYRDAARCSSDAHRRRRAPHRQAHIRPVLDDFATWLAAVEPTLLPSDPLRTAVASALLKEGSREVDPDRRTLAILAERGSALQQNWQQKR